jgi:hypothetical protein
MTLDGGQGRRPHHRLWVWLGYWLGLFFITHVPVVGVERLSFDYADKVIHLLLYFLLTWLGGRYWFVAGRAVSTATLIVYAGMYGVYAAFDEWLQQFVGRTMSLGDWLADAAGIVLATLWLVHRRRSSRVTDPIR